MPLAWILAVKSTLVAVTPPRTSIRLVAVSPILPERMPLLPRASFITVILPPVCAYAAKSLTLVVIDHGMGIRSLSRYGFAPGDGIDLAGGIARHEENAAVFHRKPGCGLTVLSQGQCMAVGVNRDLFVVNHQAVMVEAIQQGDGGGNSPARWHSQKRPIQGRVAYRTDFTDLCFAGSAGNCHPQQCGEGC